MFQLLFIVWALFCIYHLAVSEPILIELYLTQNLKVNCIWLREFELGELYIYIG